MYSFVLLCVHCFWSCFYDCNRQQTNSTMNSRVLLHRAFYCCRFWEWHSMEFSQYFVIIRLFVRENQCWTVSFTSFSICWVKHERFGHLDRLHRLSECDAIVPSVPTLPNICSCLFTPFFSSSILLYRFIYVTNRTDAINYVSAFDRCSLSAMIPCVIVSLDPSYELISTSSILERKLVVLCQLVLKRRSLIFYGNLV
jgi:hypothetical protein